MGNTINISRELRLLKEKLSRLNQSEEELRRKKREVIIQIDTLQGTAKILRKRLLPMIPHDEIMLSTQLNENTQIGDAMYAILKLKGPLFRKEIIEQLRKYRVRLSPNAPEQVLANSIKRDKKKRFVVLPDRRVSLRKENE